MIDFPVSWIYAADAVLWSGFRGLCGGLVGCARKTLHREPYAALIAAISGAMPRIFMTRFRL
jgi:hypothetical protein